MGSNPRKCPVYPGCPDTRQRTRNAKFITQIIILFIIILFAFIIFIIVIIGVLGPGDVHRFQGRFDLCFEGYIN